MSENNISATELHSMEPYQFEYFIADLWRRRGYDAEVSQQSADGGVDVIADNGRERLAIQAKRYADGNPVGVRTVREMAGVANRSGFDRAAIATTGEFTREAYREANEHDVKLFTGEQLVRMDRSAPSSPPGRAAAGLSILTTLATLDPQKIIDFIVNLIYLFLVLVVAYTIIDSVATHIFDFPLPSGI